METEYTKNEQMEIARIRFGLIAPMVQGTFPDESLAAYCRRVAAFPVKLPDGRQVQYKAKTLTKWLSLYNRGHGCPYAQNPLRQRRYQGDH